MTSLICCVFQFDCSVQAGSDFIALSPLLQTHDNYVATNSLVGDADPDATFYLSLCAPLRPISGVLCPPGAGACMVGQNGKPKVRQCILNMRNKQNTASIA